ncbi:MAG: Gfo/Idh/MocA family oxidoreductase [Holophagaceae bacterium]|nr:Gfo/Idh/MocA family oxidoreductase [Holophagaceae bacterium]
MNQKKISRRSFLQASALTGATVAGASKVDFLPVSQQVAGATRSSTMMGVPFEKYTKKIRMGMIGVGARGDNHLRNFLTHPDDVEIVAISDISPANVQRAKGRFSNAGLPEPTFYTRGEDDWKNLCKRGDLDLVYIATPWPLHTPNAVAAMEGGAHAATEIPAAMDLQSCWQLVQVSEKTRRHCMMMENCNYGQEEMMVLNMVKEGLFGTVTHAEAAYIHMLSRGFYESTTSVGPWRRPMHTRYDGNHYPCHGLGPVCWYFGVHKGDRLATIVSLSSTEAALSEFMKKSENVDQRVKAEKYICGDMNTSIIRTALGRTIMLQHDVVTPRPYSRHNFIQGTKGAFAGYPARICIEGVGNRRGHSWDSDMGPWHEKYDHPMWKELAERARGGGHGGMDWMMNYRLIQCMKEGITPDFNCYDAAAWSAPFPLSVASVKNNGAPQEFPDFTNGHWK